MEYAAGRGVTLGGPSFAAKPHKRDGMYCYLGQKEGGQKEKIKARHHYMVFSLGAILRVWANEVAVDIARTVSVVWCKPGL